jgi:hypothetical protein
MKKGGARANPFHTYLRRLASGGRSNMYGAVPYLMQAFTLSRDDAFRVICEWLDQQAELAAMPAAPDPAAVAPRVVGRLAAPPAEPPRTMRRTKSRAKVANAAAKVAKGPAKQVETRRQPKAAPKRAGNARGGKAESPRKTRRAA